MDVLPIAPLPSRSAADGPAPRRAPSAGLQRGAVVVCPLCGAPLPPGEYEAHYALELARLRDPVAAVARAKSDAERDLPQAASGKRGAALNARRLVHSQAIQLRSNGLRPRDRPDEDFDAEMALADGSAGAQSAASLRCLEVLRRARKGRRERLEGRGGRRRRSAAASAEAEAMECEIIPRCPICGDIVRGNEADINAHVDGCLAAGGAPRGEPVAGSQHAAGEDSEQYEVYSWAGQTRVRASTMVVGGFANAAPGVHSSGSAAGRSGAKRARVDSDEDADIDVDDDATAQFGEAQYGEDSIVRLDEEAEYGHVPPSGAVLGTGEGDAGVAGTGAAVVIASLKSRIRELEAASNASSAGTPRCLICMERYAQPLVSVLCWHVHCERCWLQTLGVKRLCPQCNTITAPPDLRKIYL